MQEQELYTNTRIKHNEKDPKKKNEIDSSCRLCKKNNETVEHMLTACPMVSSSLYLEVRHNYVAKLVYEKILQKYQIENKSKQPLKIISNEECEVWWDEKVLLPAGVKHNKPDIIVWDKKEKRCFIVEISVPADININRKIKEKYDNYYPLVGELQRMYHEYQYKIIPIIVGALGLIPKELEKNINDIGFEDFETSKIIKEIQKRALLGSLKIAKTFMKMI